MSVKAEQKVAEVGQTGPGFILQSDNSRYAPPTLEAVEKIFVIPREWAETKIFEMHDDMEALKRRYDMHVIALKGYHLRSLEETRKHYISYIEETKTKALRHVEIQKNLRTLSEEKLNHIIKTKEETIEDMRDAAAMKTLEHKRAESDAKMAHAAELLAFKKRSEETVQCTVALEKIIGAIEESDMEKRLIVDETLDSLLDGCLMVSLARENEGLRTQITNGLERETLLEGALQQLQVDKASLSGAASQASTSAAVGAVMSALLQGVEERVLSNQIVQLEAANKSLSVESVQLKDEIANLQEALSAATAAAVAGPVDATAAVAAVGAETEEAAMAASAPAEAAEASVAAASPEKVQFGFGASPQGDAHAEADAEAETESTAHTHAATTTAAVATAAGAPVVVASSSAELKALQERVALLERQLEEKDRQMAATIASSTATAAALQSGAGQQSELQSELDRLKESLVSKEGKKEAAGLSRAQTKKEIKTWMKNFEASNGRAAEKEDKEAIRDQFVALKAETEELEALDLSIEALKTKIAEIEGKAGAAAAQEKLVQQTREIARLTQLVASLEAAANSSGPAPGRLSRSPSFVRALSRSSSRRSIMPANDDDDQQQQQQQQQEEEGKEQKEEQGQQAQPPAAATGGLGGQPDAAVGGLEDADVDVAAEAPADAQEAHIIELEDMVAELNATLETQAEKTTEMQRDLEETRGQYAALVAEKRTDVVKRMSEDIEGLNERLSTQATDLAAAKADKVKAETKSQEMEGRAKRAETELSELHKATVLKLKPADEKVALQSKIQKQRQEIQIQSAAASVGWDAAAEKEQIFEVEVEKAYQRGLAEMRDVNQADARALNAAIEEKETRLTDLVVKLNSAESVATRSKERAEKAEAELEQMREYELTGGDGEGGGASSLELARAREELDAAQEEVVDISEKVEGLEESVKLAGRRAEILQTLLEGEKKKRREAEAAAVKAEVAATSRGRGGGGGGGGAKKKPLMNTLSKVVSDNKMAIGAGTGLWKSGKRDDCYDLYLSSCKKALDVVHCTELTAPLEEALGAVAASNNGKAKKAVTLRKAMDRLITDCGNQDIVAAEDAAIEAAKSKQSGSGGSGGGNDDVAEDSDDATFELLQELQEIKDEEAANAPVSDEAAGGDSEGAQPSEGTKNGGKESSARSLLNRAQAAEATVERLKEAIIKLREQGVVALPPGAATAAATAAPAAGAAGYTKPAPKVDVSAAEIRRLKKKVAELERNGGGGEGGGGGGGGGAAAKRETAKLEKKLKKEVTEAESALKKEKASNERKLQKLQAELKKAQESLVPITEQRDKLREQVKDMHKLQNELKELRLRAGEAVTLAQDLKTLTDDHVALVAQFKVETTLRKKYKNELEDLKGAIRVYARCRPFAGYEKEKGCKQVVTFKDESQLSVQGSRGLKDYEFNQAYNMESTQVWRHSHAHGTAPLLLLPSLSPPFILSLSRILRIEPVLFPFFCFEHRSA
jgi:hypothetical protein